MTKRTLCKGKSCQSGHTQLAANIQKLRIREGHPCMCIHVRFVGMFCLCVCDCLWTNLSDRNKIKYRKKKKRWDTSSMPIVHSQPCMRCLILVFPPLSFPNRGCFVGSPLPSCIFISQKKIKKRGGWGQTTQAGHHKSEALWVVPCTNADCVKPRTFVVFKIFPMSRAVLVNVEFRSKSRYRMASVR